MPYVTGNITDFGSRLHQLGDSGTMPNFKVEASGYWPTYDVNTQLRYQQEARMIAYRYSGQGASGIFAGASLL